jgi:hypothetical protein
LTVAALFVDPRGVYPKLLGRRQCWANDLESAPGNGPRTRDDAREYAGPDPVVAHPPCNLWVNMAAVNWKRYRRQRPAWYPGGDDGGCFAAALAAVRKYGGVLEHPAGSHAWAKYKLIKPRHPDPRRRAGLDAAIAAGQTSGWWYAGPNPREWTCEVWQSAYGGRMRKRTWLVYCGTRPPFELNWAREPGTHQCGWFDRNKPTVGKREASATPEAFALELIRLAEWSRV